MSRSHRREDVAGSDNAAPTADQLDGRKRRRDARHNQKRVLTAAAEIFARDGISAPVDEIARRAGVGAGTVYRHFPTKELLFAAVIEDLLEPMLAQAQSLGETGDPDAFFTLLTAMVEACAHRQDLADAFSRSGIELPPATQATVGELHIRLGDLFTLGQRAGVIRTDITLDDLGAILVGGVTMAHHRGNADAVPRMIEIVADGLRPRA